MTTKEFDLRVVALPAPFQERIAFFRRRADWQATFGDYELFSCEEAVKIANHVRDPQMIRAFYDSKEQQRAAGISGDHSGNTFAQACRLASLYLRAPRLVPQAHGALCPLVGCKDYGCHAGDLPNDDP